MLAQGATASGSLVVQEQGTCLLSAHCLIPLLSQESWMGTCSARLSAWMPCSTGASSMMSTISTATPWPLPLQSKATIAMALIRVKLLILLDARCLNPAS